LTVTGKTICFATPETTLVGSNRSGKTTLLKAISIVAYLLHYASDENGNLPASTKLQLEERGIVAKLSLNDDDESFFRLGTNSFTLEVRFSNGAAVDLSLTKGTWLLSIRHHDPLIKVPHMRFTLMPRDLSLCFANEKRVKDGGVVENIRTQLSEHLMAGSGRGFYTANLVNFLERNHPEEFARLNKIIGEIFPGIGNLQTEVLMRGSRIKCTIVDDDGEGLVWHAYGSGVAYAVCLFATILFNQMERFRSLQDLSSLLHRNLSEFSVNQLVVSTHQIDWLLVESVPETVVSMDSANPRMENPSMIDAIQSLRDMDVISKIISRPDEPALLAANRML
ncbi:hypothetical protein HKX48_009499, partial [Thoreauomyces humboldtii]